jgi:hypothetical protein
VRTVRRRATLPISDRESERRVYPDRLTLASVESRSQPMIAMVGGLGIDSVCLGLVIFDGFVLFRRLERHWRTCCVQCSKDGSTMRHCAMQ